MIIPDLAYLEDISEGTTPTGGVTEYLTYKVKRGDTLSGITEDYYENGDSRSCYKQVAKVNRISNPNLIYPGQKIKIPAYLAKCGWIKGSQRGKLL